MQDPEVPDDPEEKLFWTMINLDMSNISEVQRVTKLEMQGCIDQAGLDEFAKACLSLDTCSKNVPYPTHQSYIYI